MDKSKIEKTLDRLRSIPESIITIFTEYHKKLDLIRSQSTVSIGAGGDEIRAAENKKAEQTRAAKDEAKAALINLKDVASERETIIRKQIEFGLGLRLDTEDVQENLLRETRMNQAWARLKPILDKEDQFTLDRKVAELTEQFVSASDSDSVATLKREIPLYIAGRFPQNDVAFVSEAVMNAFDEALAANSVEGGEALSYKRQLDTGIYQLKMAIDYCESAIKNDEFSFPMPTFKQGETLIVNQKGADDGKGKNAFQI